MSEEKWYTYPEDDPDSGRGGRGMVKAIILGLVVALLLGLAAFMFFSGRVGDIAVFSGGPIWITVTTIPFVLILVIFLIMLRARNATPVFANRESRSVMFVITVGLIILGLAVMMVVWLR